MCCPNCNTAGFTPTLVSRSDVIRSYCDSGPVVSNSVPMQAIASPMKIGDTFEDLKRKMAPMKQQSTPAHNSAAVIITNSTRLRTFSPDASLDRLVVSPLEFDRTVTANELNNAGEETETRPVQTSARDKANEQEGEEKRTAEQDALFLCGRPLRGIALHSGTPTPSRRSSHELVIGGGDNVKLFATQFVSKIFLSSVPSLAKIRPFDGESCPSGTLPGQ